MLPLVHGRAQLGQFGNELHSVYHELSAQKSKIAWIGRIVEERLSLGPQRPCSEGDLGSAERFLAWDMARQIEFDFGHAAKDRCLDDGFSVFGDLWLPAVLPVPMHVRAKSRFTWPTADKKSVRTICLVQDLTITCSTLYLETSERMGRSNAIRNGFPVASGRNWWPNLEYTL